MLILNWLSYHLFWTAFFISLFVIFFVVALVLVRLVKRKIRNLAVQLGVDFRTAGFILIILSNYPLNRVVKFIIHHKRIVIVGSFPSGEEGKLLVVSNHPSWLDQVTLTQAMLSYLQWLKNPNIFPVIGTAKDSIVKLPLLTILSVFNILAPVERQTLREAAETEEVMVKILNDSGNLIISGPAGRDFKKTRRETIYSPLKQKPLRKFRGLCGRLATLPGVRTVPVYIEDSEKLFYPIDGGKEMKFSYYNFFIKFLLLGKIRILIVISETPLILGGWKKEKARKKIEEIVLHLADTC